MFLFSICLWGFVSNLFAVQKYAVKSCVFKEYKLFFDAILKRSKRKTYIIVMVTRESFKFLIL